jgi:WS/DGAT/MGAT family acyltransferase
MPVTDALFLLAERREHPLHVGGLHLYRPPAGAGPDYVRDLYRDAVEEGDVMRLFRRRARRPLAAMGYWSWQEDADLDIEYHLRHSALPHPGRVRELLTLVSRLHGTLLDRTRPLWEVHLIEGLDDGRYATYTKIHHALMDGVTAMGILRGLSTDPDERGMSTPYSQAAVDRYRPRKAGGGDGGPDLLGTARSVLTGGVDAVPASPLNVPITGARRFAADSWDLERLRAVGKGLGGTLNDVVLAMCSGALRRYLDALGGLPDEPLVAMVPVSLSSDDRESGNAVGLILCNLGTHLDDPVQRFELIHQSTQAGKLELEGLNQTGILLLSGMSFAPLALGPLFRFEPLRRPPFNIVISNVPGPRRKLYWNGAELDGIYPASIPSDGQALNITCTSYADRMEFGLTGAREAVPSLQRLLDHLETSLLELEKAA